MRYRTMVYYIQLGNAVTHKLYQRGVIKLLDSVIGVNEASKITGLSAGTIKNYCAEGKIVSKKIGQTWVIDKNILNEDNIASIESVEYGKLNTDTGYNHFIVADVEIETVEEYEEYNVNLGNVRAFKELE